MSMPPPPPPPQPSGGEIPPPPPPGPTPSAGVQYKFETVRVVRGMENRTITKRQKEGWEFVSQTQGKLRTEMTFRRVKRNIPVRLLAIVGAVVVLLVGTAIGVAVAVGGDDASEPVAASTTTVETHTGEPTEEPTEEPTDEPSEPEVSATEGPTETETPEPEYVYEGPKYEVVAVDNNQTPADLTAYWVLTDEVDYANDKYKDKIELLIEDVARTNLATDLIVQVVSLKDVALAEAASTYRDFAREKGDEYVVNEIPQLEVKHWIASYTGGFNYNTGKASTADAAYELVWRPYDTYEAVNWKPEIE
ncbi:hypothetical protein F0U44_02820 [Nocardioides humilatus]|uniref:Uncharacterized protein n=1 Tax=Nocardioides humilatus TaxID=2607660 RepID=A0A5B1LKP0_9ACTN|nr:hypothetical protein [Nocardioides humilatus]KAA1421262.1 hypothetical protein F0U44_02820 [Nocardioides humilatus]